MKTIQLLLKQLSLLNTSKASRTSQAEWVLRFDLKLGEFLAVNLSFLRMLIPFAGALSVFPSVVFFALAFDYIDLDS